MPLSLSNDLDASRCLIAHQPGLNALVHHEHNYQHHCTQQTRIHNCRNLLPRKAAMRHLLPLAAARRLASQVLTRLDARTLAVAALSCRFWAAVAAFRLAQQRLLRAQAALCDTAAAVPRLAATIMGIRRDELDELRRMSGPPARPLAQLFFALEVLWRRYLRRRARRGRRRRQSCLPPPQQQQAEQTCMIQNRRQCQRDEVIGSEQPKAEMQQHSPAVKSGETSDPKSSRMRSSSGSNGSKARGNEACELETGEGPNFDALRHSSNEFALSKQPSVVDSSVDLDSDLSSDEGGEEISDLDPEPVHLDSQTWRMASWEFALELLQHRDFPLPAMLTALPLGPRALAALRCRTGSADDLDFYVPQLRSQDVARLNASAGRLAEWLLGVEAHCRAAHEADRARTWSWPRHMIRKHEAFVSSETPQRGHGYETREADSRAVASDARDIGRENQSQSDGVRDDESQAGANQAASVGGGTGVALNGCEMPYGGACAIKKREPRDAGLEVGKGAGSVEDAGIRGSANGWDGAPGMSHVGDQGEAGRGGRGRWPSAAAAARSMRDCVGALLEERRAEATARAEAEAEARAAAAAAAATAGTTAAAVPTALQFVDEPRPLSSADPLRLGGHTLMAEGGGAEDWEGDDDDDDSDATSSSSTDENWKIGHED
ncbi:hypothetical protein Vafri_16395 [Volvox africanus]|uniref:Uncharacterized protein n=1 Tax=Volvox africanus TaxID=51714 RepID=A0A8J4BIR4_9CHLO|nr:hypothetical protein Vafri_16395 [Volvox africanus]